MDTSPKRPAAPLGQRLALAAGRAAGKVMQVAALLAGAVGYRDREAGRLARNEAALGAVRRFSRLPRWYRDLLRPRFHLGPRVRYAGQSPEEMRARLVRAEAKRARRRVRTRGLVVLGDRRQAFERATGLLRTWGDCYGYCLVATGRADVMIDPAMNPWDCAAGWLLIEEAGGKLTKTDGNLFDINLPDMLCSNSLLHEQMIEVLNEVKPRMPKI